MNRIYAELGVRPVINAAGTLTRLSGTRIDPAVMAAMAEAASSLVPIDQLQAAVGRRIAALASAEAALVTSGAAAGLTLAAAACLCRFDPARMDRLPDTSGMPAEIVIARSHRNGYDHALRAAGARLVEVGLAERTRDPQAWEIDAAIGPATVAVAYSVDFSPLDLREVIEVAHARDVPVIVDAAAALPPRANLRRFVEWGADLVTFSGGKAIRGPQASGILCGRRELVASAALQMWDLDVLPALWSPPEELVPAAVVARGVPNHGIGRAMKVGKEQIVGLWVALERFLAEDEAAQCARLAEVAHRIVARLGPIVGIEVGLVDDPSRWPLVRLDVRPPCRAGSAVELARKLEAGQPPVYLVTGHAAQGRLAIDPFCLEEAEIDPLIHAVRQAAG